MAQRVTDEGNPRKYRTEIPNIVLTLGLTPYELTLYVHLKRTAGADGICWKSTATLARETGMSSGMISKAKLSLQRVIEPLTKPLIIVSDEVNQKGGKPNHSITVTDVWLQNMAHFASSQDEVANDPRSPHERASSSGEVASSYSEFTSSPHEIRNKPQEEITLEEGTLEEPQRASPRADARGTRLPDDFCLNSSMREWATLSAPHVDLETALAEFCDYWRGIPGQRGKKLDWPATWRNRMRELEGRAMKNGKSNGTYTQNNELRRTTAAERNNEQLKRNLARVEQLRRQSGGDSNEVESGNRSTALR